MIKRLIKNILPIYIRIYPTYYWLAIWSAPTTPAKTIEYFKALRITIRHGEFHSKLIYQIKKGLIY